VNYRRGNILLLSGDELIIFLNAPGLQYIMDYARNHTIDEALEIIKLMHDCSEKKPLLIAVHSGGQNAGKSYFCKYALEHLHEDNKYDIGMSKENPDAFVTDNYNTLEYLLFHVGTNIPTPDNMDIELWNRKIIPFTKRPCDLNVFIYNPLIHDPNLEIVNKHFDIIIANKNSKIKTKFQYDSE
jgi:hypothetical protein